MRQLSALGNINVMTNQHEAWKRLLDRLAQSWCEDKEGQGRVKVY